MKILQKILWALVYALPAALFFSYYPIISLGSNRSMNFELSLPLIWLVVFDVVSFIILLAIMLEKSRQNQQKLANSPAQSSQKTPKDQQKSSKSTQKSPKTKQQSSRTTSKSVKAQSKSWKRQTVLRPAILLNLPGLSDRRFFLLSLFPLYLTLSILWSDNPVRGILTAGVAWAVFCAVFSLIYILPLCEQPANLRRNVLKSIFFSSIAVCIFCFAQSILDVAGLARENTLLCAGCTSWSFGFPHPSGFAIEPQFMGNLLLAPTLVALYLLIFRPSQNPKTQSQKSKAQSAKPEKLNLSRRELIGLTLITIIITATLFFTFSRGAIYAYAVALLALFIFTLTQKTFRWSLIVIPVASFLISLTAQGIFAQIGPTSETFVSGVTKSIHQLSLGVIDLRQLQPAQTVENSAETMEKSTQDCGKDVQNYQKYVDKDGKTVENCQEICANLVQNTPNSVQNPAQNPVENSTNMAIATDTTTTETPTSEPGNEAIFEGYVAESTNIRLSLNGTAIQTWLDAPGRSQIKIGSDCNRPYSELCSTITVSSILFGVGIGGAGTAMHAKFPENVTSPKEIVQNQFFSFLLETGLVGIIILVLDLLICFWPKLFSARFLDGRDASIVKVKNVFWHHPALPMLLALIIAYTITLNFFSGLPNALQIYLMPPLLYYIFLPRLENIPKIAKTKQPVNLHS